MDLRAGQDGRPRGSSGTHQGLNDPYSSHCRVPCNHPDCEDIADIPISPGVSYDRLLWTCPRHRRN